MASHRNIKDNISQAFDPHYVGLSVAREKVDAFLPIGVIFKASCDFFNNNYSANFSVNRCI